MSFHPVVVGAVLDRVNQASLKPHALGFPQNPFVDGVGPDICLVEKFEITSAGTSMATTRYMTVAGAEANVAVTFPLGEIDRGFFRSNTHLANFNELRKPGVVVTSLGADTSFGMKAACEDLVADNLAPVLEELRNAHWIHALTFNLPDKFLSKSKARTTHLLSSVESEIGWLRTTYELASAEKIPDALRVMYWEIEDLFAARNFLLLNHSLTRVNLNQLTVELMVGLIRATYRGRLVLPAWDSLLGKIKEEMRSKGVPNWERLLVGLEAKNQP